MSEVKYLYRCDKCKKVYAEKGTCCPRDTLEIFTCKTCDKVHELRSEARACCPDVCPF